MSDIMLERSSNVKKKFWEFDFPNVLPYAVDQDRMDFMTISIGFRCRDSIIVCADREITYPRTGKIQKEKVWGGNYDGLSVAVTGAGSYAHLESAATKIINRFKGATLEQSPKIVRDVFNFVVKREWFQKPGCPSPGSVPFDLIVAVSDSKHLKLLRMEQGVLKQNQPFELAGSGAPWAQYFFDQYHHYPSLVDGITLGAYMVYVVKKSGLGCGGPTDLWIIQPGKTTERIAVKYLDSAFAGLHIPFRDLLFGFSSLGLSDIEFDKELQRIGRLLKARRAAYKRKWHRPISIIAEEIPE